MSILSWKNRLQALLVGAGIFSAVSHSVPAAAQGFTVLHSFPPFFTVPEINSDGVLPSSGLVVAGRALYGLTAEGGASGQGVVFKINVDGTGFTNLHSFSGGSDGANPYDGLVLSGTTLFGTTRGGGAYTSGTVFALQTDGTGFRTVHSFEAGGGISPSGWVTNSEGANPVARLVLSGNTLYGTALHGGSSGWGTVFAVNTDGSGFANLHGFNSDSDGAFPAAGLLLSGDMLYGTATTGGASGNGTVFGLHTDGTGFATLYSFSMGQGPGGTNSDGGHPTANLIISGNTLYGTAYEGGATGNGTVFSINTDGTGFTTLHAFGITDGPGGYPSSALLLLGDKLYGTAADGGFPGVGSVFGLKTDGTDFANFYSFTGGDDGAYPASDLVVVGNTLYGTSGGSVSYKGAVFGLSLGPKLSIVVSGSSITLAWPTNAAGFDFSGYIVESTINLSAPVWTTNLPAPTIVKGQYSVTTGTAGTQQFFRLVR